MITKKNIYLNFFYIKGIIIFLSIFILKVNSETKIIAKKGDTLFKLSKQYSVSLKELMHKNNFNDANLIIEGEIIILPIKNINNDNKNIIHKVKKGDSLYKIARDYNVNLKDIISINNLDNSSFLKPDQIILLPKGAIYKKTNNINDNKSEIKIVSYHQTSEEEKISKIAMIHKIPRTKIITLNTLTDPIKISPNTKLKIRDSKALRWLKYGSLTINWSDWTYLDGNYITQAKNKRNKSFYIAISCDRKVLNNTLKNSYWTNWYFPKNDFEFKLLNDFCNKDFTN